MARNIDNRFRRRPRGSVHLVGVERRLFSWIYLGVFATRAQLTLAVRGVSRTNDRYIARALRKLFDHAYISKVPCHPFTPDIYCVSGRCVKGKDAAVALFGDASRIVQSPSKVKRSHLDHTLAITWLRILAYLSSGAHQWAMEFLDHQAVTQIEQGLPIIPDAAIILDKDNSRDGKRLFLIEYQRWESARKTTRQKLLGYLELLPEYERLFGAARSWVLLIMERPDQWVAQLARQIEQERILGTFFFAASERVLSVRPDGLWTEPVFYLPGERGPCSIFETRQEGGILYESG